MLKLSSVKKLWDRGGHNAFTDLCYFKQLYWLTFREASEHISNDGIIVVLKSKDAEQWQLAAEITMEGNDLRDPKIIVTPDNQLLMTVGAVTKHAKKMEMQSYIYFSNDGQDWGRPKAVGRENEWLWRTRFIGDDGYGVSYSPTNENCSLFKLSDCTEYHLWVDDFFSEQTHGLGYPNEHDLFSLPDQKMGCLLRRDADSYSAQLGVSDYPYQSWEWYDLGLQLGGPVVVSWDKGKLLMAARLHNPERTSLCYLHVEGLLAGTSEGERSELNNPSVEELLVLPSGGDNSYPGLVIKDEMVWCSYYSSHEGKATIYIAKLKIKSAS
ncbi:MAG: hypothetical protein ACJA0N_001880 [Pseudohongiellaceae bacterium]|jgi:hypothetical protein